MAQLSDLRTLEAARAAAQEIFAVDPQFARPEHRALAERVAEFWHGAGDVSLTGGSDDDRALYTRALLTRSTTAMSISPRAAAALFDELIIGVYDARPRRCCSTPSSAWRWPSNAWRHLPNVTVVALQRSDG